MQTTPSLKIAHVMSLVSLNAIEARLTCIDKTAPQSNMASWTLFNKIILKIEMKGIFFLLFLTSH